jgi:plasmid segregation protein ParM
MKIGLDIGYSGVKVAWGTGRLPSLLRLPVGAAPLSAMSLAMDGTKNTGTGHRVLINDVEWVGGIDPAAIPSYARVMDSSYPKTDEFLALARAALSAVGAPVVESLVIGLPVAQSQNDEERDALVQRLVGRHYIRDSFVVDVQNVLVVAQPAGAFTAYNESMSRLGKEHQINATDTILIVDPGHYSLDWIVYRKGFNHKAAGSTTSAGDVIVTSAARKLSKQYGVRVSAARLESAILDGLPKLTVGTVEIAYQEALEAEAMEIVEANLKTILGSIRSVSESDGVDAILVAGGGAKLFSGALQKHFPSTRVIPMEDSVQANAKGFYTIAGYILSRKAAA